MKKLFVMLTVLCMMAALCMPVLAANEIWMADRADLLTDEEELLLRPDSDSLCGIYAVTVDNYLQYGSTPQEAAEMLYIELTMMEEAPSDGVLLMLSMADRDYSFITYGPYAEAVFTDGVMWDMEDRFLSYFGRNDWYGGFQCYFSDAEDTLRAYDYAAKEQFGDGYVSYYEPGVPDVVARAGRISDEIWLAVVGGSMAIALVICLVMRAGMRTAREATHADAYIPAGGVDMKIKQDLYTHSTTRVIHHPKSEGSSGGGGGGGFRGHSGKF